MIITILAIVSAAIGAGAVHLIHKPKLDELRRWTDRDAKGRFTKGERRP